MTNTRTLGFIFCFGWSALAHGQAAPEATPAAPTPAPAPSPRTLDEVIQELDRQREALRQQTEELARVKAALPPPSAHKPGEAWFEKLRIRGYTQIRYNQLPSGMYNPNLINDQGDKSIGQNGGIFIRRARFIVQGDVHSRVAVYLQVDFASAISDQLNVGIVRDWYADLFLDAKKEFRLRVGQSKVPFGFENLQSSQNRLPFDRDDAINSGARDERDLGVFFYWAPDAVRKRFKHLVDGNLKGSGDYGAVALGFYNGQGANRFELNAFPHVVGRVVWPITIGNQILEIGGGGYYGQYTINKQDVKDSAGATVMKYTTTDPKNTLLDARGYGQVVLYPQPVGFVLEYTAGYGPSQGKDDPSAIDSRFLHGGYAMVMYKIDNPIGTKSMIPYVRGQLYQGGKKFNVNAPRYDIKELEAGLEWQINDALEVTAAYTLADRTSDKYPYNQEYGHLTRLQLQFNY